ncbi:T9SS type A sorting domain-containing protein [Polaribacter sp. AHE13PA]|uniref:T9SS type A sorting domain-containing protein n=1 Tax=Polaribacter sp. AHE13PA TaxID=2745562 RepID=UPI001C4EA298|nr:T9SS type A sorting domain-containing protein [Polaribacter sp. AHE13PA]QXP65927.1 T9SS type A sorting domain-containing protein [Polaribacter sp. AHE13PA]
MKKNYIFTLLLTLCLTGVSFGQEMLLNGGFENWDDDTSPTSWTKAESITKEATEIHGGSFSAKHVGGTKDLGQTITGITAGAVYTITLWYKVSVETDGTDIRIWSYWKDAENESVLDDLTNDIIRGGDASNGYFTNNVGTWTKYEATVTAPVGAVDFYFELRTYKGATVYWDDLSFVKNATASLSKNSIEGFTTYPNPITNKNFTISSNSSDTKEVSLFSVIGKRVFSTSFSGLKKNLDVSAINSGVYILKVTETGKTATKKLVIR